MANSNRLGHPVRNRKKNRLIFNDNEETSFGSNRKNPPTPIIPSKTKLKNNSKQDEKQIVSSVKVNKNVGTIVAERLKNILKDPKYNKWIANEWFYSTIDQVLFLEENEFSYCLKESFPQLKTRNLTRTQWSHIRRLMGKPRLFSDAFLEEERATLNAKRDKIRYLQHNKVTDLTNYKDLPAYIPQHLVVGTRVIALTGPNKQLENGIIEGIDPENNTYRVNFDKPELGCLTIPDFEIASCDPPILSPLTSFQIKPRKLRLQNWATKNENLAKGRNDKVVLSQPLFQNSFNEKYLGKYPIRFLAYLAKVTNALNAKRASLLKLKQMNDDAERMVALSIKIEPHFKREYALNIAELEKLNKESEFYLAKIKQYCAQLEAESQMKLIETDTLMQKSQTEAQQVVEKTSNKFEITERNKTLITNLMSLLFYLRNLKNCTINANEIQSLNDAFLLIKNNISEKNTDKFRSIEIQIRHILNSVTHLGNVGAFFESQQTA